ncbi:dienelactone hydrolase family protein [Labrys monachus]|uniref:Dienelactone hydrolase n=1 Tax=Labrys monachus TaxID=217067 RepID=A0ABU0FDH0_9HYPH|nr:dienelactone hydrolase family protein [Labrys monachus]MDQ0392635.1 dienelactone hydrolase [Labrys monachus]
MSTADKLTEGKIHMTVMARPTCVYGKEPVMYKLLILLSFLILGTSAALAGGVTVSTLQADVDGTGIPITLYRPDGKGPFPLVILSHGMARDKSIIRTLGPGELANVARIFANSGAAVAVPIRRGYGNNGPTVEFYKRDCSRPDFYDVGLAGAENITATIHALSGDPTIDASRIVLVGYSVGGLVSVAAATKEKVLGVISFAGGHGSDRPDHVNCQDELVSAFKQYGENSKVPELWIYSENDHFINIDVAKSLRDAFVTSGGSVKFLEVPPYGKEGHNYIQYALGWKASVDAFLTKIGFWN